MPSLVRMDSVDSWCSRFVVPESLAADAYEWECGWRLRLLADSFR